MSISDLRDEPGEGRPITNRTVLVWLACFLGVMLIANGFLVHFALSTFPGLDNPSSYKAGRYYASEIEAARAQAMRNWTVMADIARSGTGANIELVATDHGAAPVRGVDFQVRLGHPADRRNDVTIPLAASDPGRYRGSAELLTDGWWSVTIVGTRDGETVYKSVERIRIRQAVSTSRIWPDR